MDLREFSLEWSGNPRIGHLFILAGNIAGVQATEGFLWIIASSQAGSECTCMHIKYVDMFQSSLSRQSIETLRYSP